MPSTTSLQLAARYTRIFKLADVSPERALAAWAEQLSAHSAAPFLAVHARALRILIERIRRSPSTATATSAAVERASSVLAEAKRVATADKGGSMGFTLSDTQRPPIPAETEEGFAERPRRLLNDCVALKQLAADWSDNHWCTWLLEGFAEIIGGSNEAYSSFPPLRLYPVGNYLTQLADALTDGQPADSPVRDRISRALRRHLIAGGSGDARDALSWELFAAFGLHDPNAGVARLFVTCSAAKGNQVDDETLEQICAYAWGRCVNETARADFFRSLAPRMGERIAGWGGAADLDEISAVAQGGETELFEVARRLTSSESFHSEVATLQLEWILSHTGLYHFEVYSGGVSSSGHLRQVLSEMALKATRGKPWAPPTPHGADKILAELVR